MNRVESVKLNEMSDEQLKALAYDELMKITNAQRNYEMLRNEIARRAGEANGASKNGEPQKPGEEHPGI